jgi:hypothetical protein
MCGARRPGCYRAQRALNTATFTNVNLTAQAFGFIGSFGRISIQHRQHADGADERDLLLTGPIILLALIHALFTTFETEVNTGMNNYGQRLRALWCRGDWQLRFLDRQRRRFNLFISTDETPANEG